MPCKLMLDPRGTRRILTGRDRNEPLMRGPSQMGDLGTGMPSTTAALGHNTGSLTKKTLKTKFTNMLPRQRGSPSGPHISWLLE
jgi:hypothetical protein